MSAIADVFASDRPAMIGYLMAGDPTPDDCLPYLEALAGEVDILEVGIPFSDPIADGPPIQAAATRALQAGTRPRDAFDLTDALSDRVDTPLVAMTYFNLLERPGVAEFLETAKASGIDGVIVPDLPLEEADELTPYADDADVDAIMLASPASDDDRLARLAETTRGFLYLVSTYGVTGSDVDFETHVTPLIERVQGVVDVPVAVGFGVTSADDAAAIARAGADGVVVGSAFVRRVAGGADPREVAALAKSIRGGLTG